MYMNLLDDGFGWYCAKFSRRWFLSCTYKYIYIYINTGLVMVWWMEGNWEVRNGERGAFCVSCFNGGDIWGLFFVVIVVWRNS